MNESKTRAKAQQPLQVASIDDALLKLGTLQALSGLGKTSLYARINAGELRAIKLGKRCTRFRGADVQKFLQGLGKGVA